MKGKLKEHGKKSRTMTGNAGIQGNHAFFSAEMVSLTVFSKSGLIGTSGNNKPLLTFDLGTFRQ